MSDGEYDNTNTGVLFRNEEKERDTDRDYSGSADVEGVEYWLSAWVNEAKSGKKYLKIKLKAKEERRQQARGGNVSRSNFVKNNGNGNGARGGQQRSFDSRDEGDEIPF